MCHRPVPQGLLSVVYLDEVGRWHPPLLEVLLPVLFLDLQGKAGAENALGEQGRVGGMWEGEITKAARVSLSLPI